LPIFLFNAETYKNIYIDGCFYNFLLIS